MSNPGPQQGDISRDEQKKRHAQDAESSYENSLSQKYPAKAPPQSNAKLFYFSHADCFSEDPIFNRLLKDYVILLGENNHLCPGEMIKAINEFTNSQEFPNLKLLQTFQLFQHLSGVPQGAGRAYLKEHGFSLQLIEPLGSPNDRLSQDPGFKQYVHRLKGKINEEINKFIALKEIVKAIETFKNRKEFPYLEHTLTFLLLRILGGESLAEARIFLKKHHHSLPELFLLANSLSEILVIDPVAPSSLPLSSASPPSFSSSSLSSSSSCSAISSDPLLPLSISPKPLLPITSSLIPTPIQGNAGKSAMLVASHSASSSSSLPSSSSSSLSPSAILSVPLLSASLPVCPLPNEVLLPLSRTHTPAFKRHIGVALASESAPSCNFSDPLSSPSLSSSSSLSSGPSVPQLPLVTPLPNHKLKIFNIGAISSASSSSSPRVILESPGSTSIERGNSWDIKIKALTTAFNRLKFKLMPNGRDNNSSHVELVALKKKGQVFR